MLLKYIVQDSLELYSVDLCFIKVSKTHFVQVLISISNLPTLATPWSLCAAESLVACSFKLQCKIQKRFTKETSHYSVTARTDVCVYNESLV